MKKWHSCGCFYTLLETNMAPENRPGRKRKIVFQPSIFRCELLVLGSVGHDTAQIYGDYYKPL